MIKTRLRPARLFFRPEIKPLLLAAASVLVLCQNWSVFTDADNLASLQSAIAPAAIVAVGLTILLIAGSFDLSIGAIAGLAGVVLALTLSGGAPLAVAVTAALAAGAAVGVLNGVLVTIIGINPLIATLATTYIVRGIIETTISGLGVGGFTALGDGLSALGTSTILGLYPMTWAAIVLAAGATVLLSGSRIGRRLYYAGGNPEAAAMLGLSVRRIRFAAFVAMGVVAALAGVFMTARVGMANRYLGIGLEMQTIIACLLGGASIAGGRGSVPGSILGVIFVALVNNAFNLFEVRAEWQNVAIGGVLVGAVVMDAYVNLLRRRSVAAVAA